MVYTPTFQNTLPIPVEPAVKSTYMISASGGANVPMYIPWEYCQLDYSRATVVEILGTSTMTLALKLDTSTGAELHSITLSSLAAVGAVFEGTVTTQANCENLGRHNTDRDTIFVETSGTSGSVMVELYFRSDYAG